MKVYFVRHGEGLDDVYNEFGGWSDRELSTSGIQTAFKLADKLSGMNEKFESILTSPLKRSTQTAEILGDELDLKVTEEPLLKERNTYGLLSGVNKELAEEEYPEMYDAYLKGKYISGSERYKDFVARVKVLLDHLRSLNSDSIICVTHGYLITVIIEEFMGLIRNSFVSDGCILGVEMKDDGSLETIFADGITFTENPEEVENPDQLKKFKD